MVHSSLSIGPESLKQFKNLVNIFALGITMIGESTHLSKPLAGQKMTCQINDDLGEPWLWFDSGSIPDRINLGTDI